jgi:hypothetical protein
MKIIIRKLWIYIEKPIWSFIVNLIFWIGHLNELKETLKEKEVLKSASLENIMRTFTWKEDKFIDWTPWIITLIYNDLIDDCDGAANLAKWWFKEHGVEAEILNLYSEKEGHAICVTKDRKTMVTNERVVMLHPDKWEIEVLEYFNGKYETII